MKEDLTPILALTGMITKNKSKASRNITDRIDRLAPPGSHYVEGSGVIDGLDQLVPQHRLLVVVGHVELEETRVRRGEGRRPRLAADGDLHLHTCNECKHTRGT